MGRIVPEVSHVERWPYELAGAGFGILGLAFIAIGYTRTRAVEQALDRGEFTRFGDRLALGLLVAGVVLGSATIVIVIFAH